MAEPELAKGKRPSRLLNVNKAKRREKTMYVGEE
jgi:hypothetical protein